MNPEIWMCSDTRAINTLAAGGSVTGAGLRVARHEGLAIAELRGVLTKGGEHGTVSSLDAAEKLRGLATDDAVRRVLLVIDSPGGEVRGTSDLADAVAALNAAKPVTTFADDLMASAAYWVGSQARRVLANRTAVVGSIGTYAVLYDASKLVADTGVKVHVIRAGEFKGAGTFGSEITEGQLAEAQRFINATNEHFLAGVSKGRRLSPQVVQGLADGRAHVGDAARRIGLVDGIQSFDEVLDAEFRLTVPRSSGTNTSSTATMAAEFSAKVEQLVARGIDRRKAMSSVKRSHPKWHAAYLVAANPGANTSGLREKFGELED